VEVVVVRRTTPVKKVARLLAHVGLSAVPVTDERDRVIGVVSEAELLANHRRHERGGLAAAGAVMTSPAVAVGPQATLSEAARLMRARGAKRLPVVAGSGRLVGIVSRVDLLRPLTRPDEEIRWAIEQLLGRELLVDPARVKVEVRDGIVWVTGQVERRSQVPSWSAWPARPRGSCGSRTDWPSGSTTSACTPPPASASKSDRNGEAASMTYQTRREANA
jgi:predicted transcriptional regulator